MMSFVKKHSIRILGLLIDKCLNIHRHYKNELIMKRLGGTVQYPYCISGIENISFAGHVNIGIGSLIFSTRAKVIIKQHFVSGPNLTIVTGDHMPVVGKFVDMVTDEDKNAIDVEKKYDQDVIIDEDVWVGANVTILKGVHVRRGSVIAAGSVVVRDVLPYSIYGGIPAKFIKFRWNVDQIIEHESYLYDEEDRYSQNEIEDFLNSNCDN